MGYNTNMRNAIYVSAVSAILSSSLWGGVSLPVTDMATLTDYLTNRYELVGNAVSGVRIFTADEAVSAVDRVFARADKGVVETGDVRRMKRLLAENLAFVFSYDTTVKDRPLEYVKAGKRASLPVGTKFLCYAYQERLFESRMEPIYSFSEVAMIGPRSCYGVRIWLGKKDDCVIASHKYSLPETARLPFPIRRLEAVVSDGIVEKMKNEQEVFGRRVVQEFSTRRPREDFEVEIVADIEDVLFDSIRNLNASRIAATHESFTPVLPTATYRIELIVREVLKGAVDFDRIAFIVNPEIHQQALYEQNWPFYRGLTLKVRLCREGDSLCVSTVRPVLPYRPFTRAWLTKDPGACFDEGVRLFSISKAAERPVGASAVAWVTYGDHTLVKFYSMTNLVTGAFGRFPDYSQTVRIDVFTAREGAKPAYWSTSWFSKRHSMGALSARDESVRVCCIEDGLDESALLDFSWRSFKMFPDMFKGARTLGAFLDVLEREVVCPYCGKVHYNVVADDMVRSREISIPDGISSGALELFKAVCESAGCTFLVKGSEISVRAELSEEELSDKSLKGLLRIAERDGFASVADAEYVGLSFSGRSRAGEKETPLSDSNEFNYREDYKVTGNAWVRTDPDGKRRCLVFDSMWWTDIGKGRERKFWLKEKKPRMSRDVMKIRAYLRDEVENAEAGEARLFTLESDMYALAFALHLQQCGKTEEAKMLYDELNRRPSALAAAFAKLRLRIKIGKEKYPDIQSWAAERCNGKVF